MFLLTLEEIKEFMANMSITLNLGVYRIFVYAYEVFLKLFSSRIIYNVEYREIINRIYTIIGMVMLFVIAYNILTIIVDPEKNRGGKAIEKMLSKIVVTIILIILCPSIFNWSFKIQNVIYNGNYIYNIFSTKNFNKTTVQNAAAMAAGDILGSFFYSESGIKDELVMAQSANSATYMLNGQSVNCNANNKCSLSTAKMIAHYGQYSIFRSFAKNIDLTDQNKIDFPWIIALIAGLYLAFIMVSFCIALIMRIIKLALYEIIAPIALCLGVVPSKEDLTKTWAISVIKTYLSLFIHMFVVYLSVYLLSLISYTAGPFNCTTESPCSYGVTNFSYAIYALAIFTFMKSAPKLIDRLFGLNENMNFSIKDILKKDDDKNMPVVIKNKSGDNAPSKNTIRANNMYGKAGSGASKTNADIKNNMNSRARATFGSSAQTARLNATGQSATMLASKIGASTVNRNSNSSSTASSQNQNTNGNANMPKASGTQNTNQVIAAGMRNAQNQKRMTDLYSDSTHSTNSSTSQNITITAQGGNIQAKNNSASSSNSGYTSSTTADKNSHYNMNMLNNYSADNNEATSSSEKKTEKINYEIYEEENKSSTKTNTTSSKNEKKSSNNANNNDNAAKKQNNRNENSFTIATTKKAENVIESLTSNQHTADLDTLDVVPPATKETKTAFSMKKYKTYVTKTLEGEIEIPLTPSIYCALSDALKSSDKNASSIEVTISFKDDNEKEVQMILKYSRELLETEIDNYLDLV